MPLCPRGRGIGRVSSALCRGHCAAAASPAAPRRLSGLLSCCSSVWGEGTGRGMHIRLLVRLQTPCHRAGYQSRGAVWEAGRQAGRPRMSASGSLAGLVGQQRGPAFRQQPTRTPPTGTYTKLCVPPALTPAAGPGMQSYWPARKGGRDSGSNCPGCYFSVVCLGANG